MKLKTLYIISTPINGRIAEMSPSAVETLKKCPAIILEDFLAGKKTLDLLKVDFSQKLVLELNEHTETQNSRQILDQIREFECAALISDVGTPLFADPGYQFIQLLIGYEINIVHIPAIASVLSALVLCGFDIRSFYFAGFPPRETEQRSSFFRNLARRHETMIILDTPYRFNKLLLEIAEAFPVSQNICIAFGIGTEQQFVFRGSLQEAVAYYHERIHKKDPFVIVMGREEGRSQRPQHSRPKHSRH